MRCGRYGHNPSTREARKANKMVATSLLHPSEWGGGNTPTLLVLMGLYVPSLVNEWYLLHRRMSSSYC